jgi:hypothetical protein
VAFCWPARCPRKRAKAPSSGSARSALQTTTLAPAHRKPSIPSFSARDTTESECSRDHMYQSFPENSVATYKIQYASRCASRCLDGVNIARQSN